MNVLNEFKKEQELSRKSDEVGDFGKTPSVFSKIAQDVRSDTRSGRTDVGPLAMKQIKETSKVATALPEINVLKKLRDQLERTKKAESGFSETAKEMLRLGKMPFETRAREYCPENIEDTLKKYEPNDILSKSVAEMFMPGKIFENAGKSLSPENYDRLMVGSWTGPNCYSWATGWPALEIGSHKEKPFPGCYSCGEENIAKAALELLNKMESPNSENFGAYLRQKMNEDAEASGCEIEWDVPLDYKPKEGERMVACLRRFKSMWSSDFHFMLKEKDGTWSHKKGVTFPVKFDESGDPITDPEHCNSGYNEFHGYCVIRPKSSEREN